MGAASLFRLTSTTDDGGRFPSRCACSYTAASCVATHSRSAAMSPNNAHAIRPEAASGRGSSGRTATERRRASSETELARCRASGGLRQLVRSSLVGAGDPSGSGKSVVNRGRLVADAPRQP
ncbi:Uncharacterised protein [Mycobacteroides abscessus subsp. abscessus]|nr:Uncharacterised protein [Mycobacteroides abscessus subsp. abscessus]